MTKALYLIPISILSLALAALWYTDVFTSAQTVPPSADIPLGAVAPSPVTIDGRTISFDWTDDVSGEDIILWTDKQTYTNGLSHAEVFLALENTGVSQNVTLNGLFAADGGSLDAVWALEDVTTVTVTNIEEDQCTEENVRSTTTNRIEKVQVCERVITGQTTSTTTEPQWVEQPRKSRNITKEQADLGQRQRKSSQNYIAQHSFTVPVGAGETKYYKLLVSFEPNSSGNFYIEGIGENGGYAHLDPWFDASWSNRVKIEVNPAYVDGDLTNYPVHVDLSDLPASFFSTVQADGDDIRVTESDETTETAFELVDINTGGSTGELYFLADSLSSSATTSFYIYYGNAGASGYASTTTYGSQNVWSGYRAVYHFQDDPSGGVLTDATGNGNTMFPVTAMASGDLVSGIFGGDAGAWFFEASKNEYVQGEVSELLFEANEGQAWSGWFKKSNGAGYWFWMHWSTELGTNQARFDAGGSSLIIDFRETNTSRLTVGDTTSFNTTNPYHFGFDYDGTATAAGTTGFINGSSWTMTTYANTLNTNDDITTTGYKPQINARATVDAQYDMTFSEWRQFSTTTSASFITTEYKNQNSPSTFYWVGSEESAPAGGGGGAVDKGIIIFFQ